MSGRAGKTAEKGSVEQQDVRVNEHGQARSSGSHDFILALQRMAGNRAVMDLLKRSSGRPLDADTRVEMEAKFGEDFRDVRVHAGGEAAASASLLNANAFTAGQDIAFGEGRYSPRTSGGKTLLAHELAHVVQQRRGGPTPRTFEPQSAAEQDAAAASGEFAGAGPVSVSSATGTGVAREEAKELPWWKKRLNPMYQRALEVLPKGAAEELKQANAAAKKFVEKTGTTDESLNKAVQAAEPVLKPITDYLAAKPEAPPAAKTDAEKTETWQGGPTMPLGEGLFWRQDPDPTEFETKLRAGKPFPVKIPRKPDIDPRSVNWIGGRPTDEQMGKMAFRDVNNPSRQIFVDEGTQVDLTVDSSSVMPIRDPKTHELKGYRYRHEDGMWTLDRDGKVLGARNLEKPLEHPEIDPIDVAMLGADLGPLAAKGIQAGGKALLRKIAKSGARELGEVGSEEAGTLIGREASEGLTSSASHQKEVPQIELGGNPPGDVHPLESPSVRPAEHALPDEARFRLHDLGPHEPAADVLALESRAVQPAEHVHPMKPANLSPPKSASLQPATAKKEVEALYHRKAELSAAEKMASEHGGETLDLNVEGKTNFAGLDVVSKDEMASVKAYTGDSRIARYQTDLKELSGGIGNTKSASKVAKTVKDIKQLQKRMQAQGRSMPLPEAYEADPAAFIEQNATLRVPDNDVAELRNAIVQDLTDPTNNPWGYQNYGLAGPLSAEQAQQFAARRVKGVGKTIDQLLPKQ
jgi:hypothetical protein